MSNTYKAIIVAIAVLISISGIYILTKSRHVENPSNVSVSSSSQMTSPSSSKVVLSSSSQSQILSDSILFINKVKELASFTLSGNINGSIPILMNINSEANGEYEYNSISQETIPLKILINSNNLILEENTSTFFKLDYNNLQGTWTDGKNTYPISLSKTDRLNLKDVVKTNINQKSQSKEVIPTFDSRYQTSLKLTTQNEITSISVGKCDLQTKFKTGLCQILDQNNKTIFLFNSWTGIPLLIDPAKDSSTILNISQPYIACSISKYQFSYTTKELKTTLNLTSDDCKDLNVISEIQKYKADYDTINSNN